MDLKVRLKSHQGDKLMSCIIDEVPNYLITVHKHQSKLEERSNALIDYVIYKYCIPECMIMDEDGAFMPSLMSYLFKKFSQKNNCNTLLSATITG